MDPELKTNLAALAHSLAVGTIETSLPMEEPSLVAITQQEQWRAGLEKYLRNACQRANSPRMKSRALLVVERVNFELQRRGEKRLKL